jgi:hypothetical protein
MPGFFMIKIEGIKKTSNCFEVFTTRLKKHEIKKGSVISQ